MNETLPKVETIKDKRGKVLFHFDPAKVPTRRAKLSSRVAFASAYVKGFSEGRMCTMSTLKLCVKWLEEGAAMLSELGM